MCVAGNERMTTTTPLSNGSTLTASARRARTHRNSIADRAGRSFAPDATIQGFSLWKAGAVEVDAIDDLGAKARVRGSGSRARDVALRVQADRLVATCTCAGRAIGTEGCKHVWAALLEVDRRDGWPALRATRVALPVSVSAAATSDAPPAEAARTTKAKATTAKTAPTAPKEKRKTNAPTASAKAEERPKSTPPKPSKPSKPKKRAA
jgi:hypothetical protein